MADDAVKTRGADDARTYLMSERVQPRRRRVVDPLFEGVEVLFETDFPHLTSLYPGVQEHLVEALMPQDLKLEIERLSAEEARKAARYLGWTVGQAHGRKMDRPTQRAWYAELAHNRARDIDAPSWLWRSVVALVATHETGYLEHCRRHALAKAAG